MPTLSDDEKLILTTCAAKQAEIAAKPKPPKWDSWAVGEWEELRRHGPRYQPKAWFENGKAMPEKYRVRYLRAVHKLSKAGLLKLAGTGGRLSHVKLTPEGEQAVADLAGTKPAKAIAKPKRSRRPASSVRPADAAPLPTPAGEQPETATSPLEAGDALATIPGHHTAE